MGRFPAGVAVVTVDLRGQRAGLTVASLVSLSLEPPLVGFAVRRDAALHELLRDSGELAISLLAAGQEALAQHFARGVPPIALWTVNRPARRPGPAATRRRCRMAHRPPGAGARDGRPHLLRRRGRARRGRAGRAAARLLPAELLRPVIEAVVFDLDGVLVDSEHVWDDVREELTRERGGTWPRRRQHDMIGMSSQEWSRYVRRSACPTLPGDLRRNRRAAEASTAHSCRLLPGAREAVGRAAERLPLGLASSSNREVIDLVLELLDVSEPLFARPCRPRRLGAASRRRTSTSRRPVASVSSRPKRGGRGLSQRDPLRARRRDARDRDSERALPARRRFAG